jgi:acetyl esterase/lipase
VSRATLVVTVTAEDRAGVVEAVAAAVASCGGNWEESRMARLGGRFAGILLVGVDPGKVGVFGGSAGGHLAAMLATLHDNKLLPAAPYVPDATDGLSARPAFALLLYPVIDLSDDAVTHRGSRTNLTQDTPALYEPLSPQKHVTRDTPPVFMVHGSNDRLVPVKNSLLFYEACLEAGVPVEMHILENGPHGFGMGANLNDDAIKEWPRQALRFMARHRWIAGADLLLP